MRANRDAFNKDLEKRHPPTPPKKKRVSSIRATNEPPLKKPKKKKAQLKSDELMLAKAVGMTSKTVAGKSPKELQQVQTLYEKEFSKLHIFLEEANEGLSE